MSSNATTITAAAVAAAAGLLLTGCTPTPTAISAPAPDTGLGHVHGIVDLGGSTVLLGTHTGLYTLTDTGDVSGPLGGADFDAMGLTADGDVLYASGHPGPNTPAELGEHNLGLIRSTDAGTTWEPVAFTGQEDFHVLTAGDGAIHGIGSSSITIRTSPDGGTTWIDGAELPAADLTVTTDGTLYAATRQGLQESRDAGATFDLVADAPRSTTPCARRARCGAPSSSTATSSTRCCSAGCAPTAGSNSSATAWSGWPRSCARSVRRTASRAPA